MPIPLLPARMKQRHNFSADSAGQIRPLRAIAFVTTPSEVRWKIAAMVLLGNDVFDVKRQNRIVVLMHPAIFAAIGCATANQTTNGDFHHDFLASRSRALA